MLLRDNIFQLFRMEFFDCLYDNNSFFFRIASVKECLGNVFTFNFKCIKKFSSVLEEGLKTEDV